MFSPFGKRVICKIGKKYKVDAKNKPVLDDQGNQYYEQEQVGVVLRSGIEEIKKGMKIIPLGRGGVPILAEETKKHYIVIFDAEDVYAFE